MKIIFILLLTIMTYAAIAQSNTKVDDLADISIGWKSMIKKPVPVTALTDPASGAKFTASEVTTMYNLANWMQQSWTPKGVLGYAGIVYKPEPRSKTRSFTKYENAPHGYGAFGNNYIFLKKEANGKYTNTTTHNNRWNIVVNGVTPFASLSMLNTEDEYYFFIPKVDAKGTSAFNTANFIRQSKLQGFDNHPNLANYSHFYIPALGNNSDIGNGYTILLSKDKQLPFEEVSIGEVLQRAKTAAAVNRKRSIERSNPKNKEEQKNIQDAYDRNLKGLEKLKTYYKDKLTNTAKVSQYGFTVNSFSVGGGDYMAADNLEVLEKEFTVYKISKTTKLLCQKEPQWVTVTFTPGLDDKAYAIHRMEAIIGNFNYEYLYNYFFNPELIKNKTYQPIQGQ